MGRKLEIVWGDKRPMTGRIDVRGSRQGLPDAAAQSPSRDPGRDTASQAGGAVLAPFTHSMNQPQSTPEMYPDHDLVPAVGILVSALLCGPFWLVLRSFL
jgi:hypothetical protein